MFEYCRRIRPWFGDGWELSYDMHPAVSCKDGVSLYIRNGYVKAMVEHSDGTNSNISFHGEGRWATDWRTGTAKQRETLNRIAKVLTGDPVIVGATVHHVIIPLDKELPRSTAAMILRRLGLEGGLRSRQPIALGPVSWELNAVTSYGCSVGYTNNGVRYNVQGSEASQ